MYTARVVSRDELNMNKLADEFFCLQEAVYEVCRKTFDESKYGVDICRDVPDLPGDRQVTLAC